MENNEKYVIFLNNAYDETFYLDLKVCKEPYEVGLMNWMFMSTYKHCFIIIDSLNKQVVSESFDKLKDFFINNNSRKHIWDSKIKTLNKLSVDKIYTNGLTLVD